MSIDFRRWGGRGSGDRAVRSLGIAFTGVAVVDGEVGAAAVLPDSEQSHNHVAGAAFTLAETASGAVVMAAFGATLGRATPLAVRAEISYRKLAMGPLTATARLGRPAADVPAELDAGTRPEFPWW